MKIDRNLIGIRGSAGSGKDTVAYLFGGALETYLNHRDISIFDSYVWFKKWNSLKENALKANGNILQTEGVGDYSYIYYETFADNVKLILSLFTGINYELFYDSNAKENLYFCLNTFETCWKDKLYEDANIICDDDLYEKIILEDFKISYKTDAEKYWISIRSLMVYFGSHIIQTFFGKRAWVNSLKVGKKNNNINEEVVTIISDCRFPHELSYIRENNGLILQIESNRKKIKESNSIAETSLLDNNDYDIVIDNSGNLDDLLPQFIEIIKKYYK